MPGGGTWTAQNKRRPGAYINFNAVPAPNSSLGSAGTIITILPLDWGPTDTLIELTGEELLSGKSMQKVGSYYNDSESLPLRLALQNCYRMLIYRADTGGVQATATIPITDSVNASATARYAGVAGNNIQLVIIVDRPAAGKVTLNVLYRGAVKETYILDKAGQLNDINSAWVDIEVPSGSEDEPIPGTAGITLTSGTNGTIDYTTTIPMFQEAAKLRDWSTMALPVDDDNVVNTMLQYINDLKEIDGKMVQISITSPLTQEAPANSENVIASFQGYQTATEVITPELFTLYVAGLNAGTELGISNTCREVIGATEIVNPVADGLITDFLEGGWFILSYRSDGVVVVEQDINTLHIFTADRPLEYSKNMTIRLLNTVAQDCSLIFIRDFAGKVRANKTGRDLYKSRMITYFTDLQDSDAITNFVSDDLVVMEGEQPEGVVLEVALQPVGAMEKLYMTVNIIA